MRSTTLLLKSVVLPLWLLSSVSMLAKAESGGLFFDGVNDYITLGAATNINNVGVSNFTIECWFKRQSAGRRSNTGAGGFFALPLVTKGMAENEAGRTNMNYFFGIGTNASGQTILVADFEDFSTGLNHPIFGNEVVGSNVWVHGAVTYDVATSNLVLYVNGDPDSTTNISGLGSVLMPRYDSIQHAAIGSSLLANGATNSSSGFFGGTLDEVRIWNRALTATEIANNHNLPITSDPNLIARWGLDQTSGNFASNSVSGGVTGTLTNFPASPTWTNGYFVPPTVAITNPIDNATISGSSVTIEADALDSDGTVTKVEFYSGATLLGEDDTAPFSFTWNSVAPGNYALTAVATDNHTLVATSPVVNVSVTPPMGVGGLYFDGKNDYVTFGEAPGLGVTNFTIECWFKVQGAGRRGNTGTGGIRALPLVTRGTAENEVSITNMNYFFGIGTNNSGELVLAADFEDMNNGLNHPIRGETAIASNTWLHGAVTYDVGTSNWVLYLNGSIYATTNITGPSGITNLNMLVPRFDSVQHAALGTSLKAFGVTNAADSGFFAGTMDEVRIWNYARSAEDIACSYQAQITNAPGLLARWALNDSAGFVATNSGTSAVDGTLTNGPAWVDGYAFPDVPTITVPPASTNVNCGDSVTFSVAATGSGTLTYQWYFGANLLPGETTDQLSLTNVNGSNAGSYMVVVANIASCGVTSAPAVLTVVDTDPPVIITCATNTTINADTNCQAAIPDLTPQVVASDACGPVTVSQSPLAGTIVANGNHVVTLTVTDSANNQTNCSTTVTVVDVTAPLITVCATNMTINADTNCQAIIPDLTPQIVASDTCSAITVTQSPLAGASAVLGNNVVTLTVTDAANNQATCNATVTVVDVTAPDITVCATNMTINGDTNCQATIPDMTVQVVGSDACGGSVTVTQSPLAGTLVGLGDTVVTLTVSDAGNNQATCQATITVVDGNIPSITAQPQSVTNLVGTTATFTVTATSCSTIGYQWMFGTNVLAGENASTLSIPNVQMSHAGDYTVILTNAAGSRTSDVASLTVLLPAAPILSDGPMLLPNGHFRAVYTGTPNVPYTIKHADEIIGPWQTLTNITSDVNGLIEIEDIPVVAPSQRFYRIVYP